MKQRADSKRHFKEIEIKVGDYITRVIKEKGSVVVAKWETKTITRHVTFFKRITNDFDTDISTPPTEQALARNPQTAAYMIPPPTQEQPGGEWVQQATGIPVAEEIAEERESATEANPEPMREDRPVRTTQPPTRFRDEGFEYNLEEET